MIPISDNLRFRRRPIVNYWLIGINIFIFLWEIKLELSGELGYFIYDWGLVPFQINTAINHTIINPAAGIVVFWRLLSLLFAMFLHGSFSQILGNMLFLWVFGKGLENIFGQWRYLGFYLGAGVLTGLIQVIVEPNLSVPLVGANAIAAVLGAYFMKFPKVKIDSVLPLIIVYIPLALPVSFYLLWWYIQQLFYGIGSLSIPPVGVNQPSLAYWMQFVAMICGAMYTRIAR
jgi:membrane associated rhomboid family serine protease